MMNVIRQKGIQLDPWNLSSLNISLSQTHTHKTGVSITKSKLLMLYRDIITVYYSNYDVHTYLMQHASLLFRQVEYVETNCYQGLAWALNCHM